MWETYLVAFLDMLTLLHSDFTSADFVHTNSDERHETDGRVVSFNEDDGAGGKGSQVALTRTDPTTVDLLGVRVTKTFEQRFGEIGTVLHIGLLDRAADWRVPPVVRKRRQESLVDGGACKVLRELVVRQHVDDGVRLTLDPEMVAQLGVVSDVEDLALASVRDDIVVVG